jgi:3-dehydroquinate synthase
VTEVSQPPVGLAESVTVTHALGSYPVYVAPESLSRLGEIVERHLPARRVVLIADEQVHQLLESHRLGALNWSGDVLTFPAGEQSKTRESWASLTDAMVQRRYGRHSGIVALGGGVTGDLAGFVAATYMRGVPYLQVPTTLLAMVDASVGGKTAVNTPAGKNLVGVFFPPVAVVADPLVLRTLPDGAFRGGLAEAVKHGLIADREYFEWLERQVDKLLARDASILTHLVRRSVEIKAEVVSADEREAGRRAILNAGHTVAHALEQLSGYSLPHGDAVALGLIAESALAEQLEIAEQGLCGRVSSLLSRLGLPTRSPAPLNNSDLVSAMLGDKKNRDGMIHVALVAQVGCMHRDRTWTTPVSTTRINQVIDTIR